jgi:hypothetical protein
MDDLPPSHFKGWEPFTKHYFDHFNEKWATDKKYKELGNCFEKFLRAAFNDHALHSAPIKKNPSKSRGGTYYYKRFVRIHPKGFHQNGLQIFIESFSGGTQEDGYERDPSDALYNKLGFPIPEGTMGIFIGMSAISHFLKNEKWGLEDCAENIDVAREFFFELAEKMEDAEKWALEFTGSNDDFELVQNSRVQRIRIKLPYLSLDSNDWEDCKINEGLRGLALIFGDLFAEYSSQ